MRLTLEEICKKEVVNLPDGTCFGFADDILIDTETKQVIALIMKNKRGILGFFEAEEKISLPWEEIETIGNDTILVKTNQKRIKKQRPNNLFRRILNYLIEMGAK